MNAMMQLGNGLNAGEHHEDALTVKEAELAMKRRLGVSEDSILVAQNNLAVTYQELGRFEEGNRMLRDVYSGRLRLDGGEAKMTLIAANNYASSLRDLERFREAKSLLRRILPVARRVLRESNTITLRMRNVYAAALYTDPTATLDDLREAVVALEETELLARRVLGGVHPFAAGAEKSLRESRAVLRARESGDVESIRELVAAMAASWDA